MATLGSALTVTARQRGSAPALLWEDEWLGYHDLHAKAAGVASELAAAGVRAGDRVAVGFSNSPRLVVSVLAVLRSGAVLVPLNPAYTPDELLYVADDAQLAAALVEPGHAQVLRDASLPSLRIWDDPPAATAESSAPADADSESPALIIYTSGTTGRPKGAVLSHRALLTNLRTVAEAWHWTSADRLLLTLPCFHLHGLGLGILGSLLVGSSIVLRSRFVAEQVYADLARTSCSMFFGVPTMYNRLAALPDGAEREHDLGHMRLWVSGSAPLNAATFERFRQRVGYALMDRYGMTECGFSLSTPYDEPRRPGVVGRPLPGVTVRVVDPEAASSGKIVDAPPGEQGEIIIRGPNLFSGYWRRPQETEAAFIDGHLRSGDVAVVEADGQFRILGRRSVDIIKTRGFKVGAVEIEEVMQRFPDIQEVAVVGVPDPDQGERIVAAFTARPGFAVDVDALRQHARAHLAPHKVPADFVAVDEIPRIGPGKFKKSELIRQLQNPA